MYIYKEVYFIVYIYCYDKGFLLYVYESVIVVIIFYVNNDKYVYQLLFVIYNIFVCASLIIFICGYYNNIIYYMQKYQILLIYREFYDRFDMKVIIYLVVS